MLRNIIVCAAFSVGGLCFGVMYLATYEEYADLRDGKVLEGVIDKVGDKHVWYSYLNEDGKREERQSRDVDSLPLGHTGAEEFIRALSARAPHAKIGYSKQTEQLYREDPSRFRPG